MRLGLSQGLSTGGFVPSESAPLTDLGITPEIAASMTRKLVSGYSGSFFTTSGSDVTAVLDQSGNSRDLTNSGVDTSTGLPHNATLSGSGNSARAVFSSTGNEVTALKTVSGKDTFSAGDEFDLFIVFDPISTNKQVVLSRGSTSNDRIMMQNGSGSAVSTGFSRGNIRVNNTVLSPETRGALDAAFADVAGLNILSVEDIVLNDMDGFITVGANSGSVPTFRLEGSFAEFIVTPALSDADHTAVINDITAHYS